MTTTTTATAIGASVKSDWPANFEEYNEVLVIDASSSDNSDIDNDSSSENLHESEITAGDLLAVLNLASLSPFSQTVDVDDVPQLNPVLSLNLARFSPIDSGMSVDDVVMLRRWCTAVCVVTFDLNTGPELEYLFPHVELSESEIKTICFSSFPDSNSTSHTGDTTFSFRFRSGSAILNIYAPAAPVTRSANGDDARNQTNPRTTTIIDNDAFTYAYVYFRQQADASIHRGYFQKSIVLLTPHPGMHGLFSKILLDDVGGSGVGGGAFTAVGNKIMNAVAATGTGIGDLAKTVLTEFCNDIAKWPSPPSSITCNALYEDQIISVSVFGNTYIFAVPPTSRFPQLFDLSIQNVNKEKGLEHTSSLLHNRTISNPSTPARHLQSIIFSTSTPTPSYLNTPTTGISPKKLQQKFPTSPGRIYATFSATPSLSYLLWELMVLGEPILVQAETPKACSGVVWTLIELIKPVPFGGDFRPFFTIQDSEFQMFGRGGAVVAPPSATVLGVTNPFFDKLFSHWPHKVHVCRGAPPVFALTGSTSAIVGDGHDSPPHLRHNGTRNSRTGSVETGHNSAVKSFLSSLRGTGHGSGNSGSPTPKLANVTDEMHAHIRSNNSSVVTGRGNPIVVFDAVVESVSTKYKPILAKDKKLLKEITDNAARGGVAPEHLDNLLRRHFIELTDRFLQPLNRHYEGLIVGSPLSMFVFIFSIFDFSGRVKLVKTS
ncbi:Protein dennd6a [Physocladia obscura]|uniref:Protein dennd6a n=1 Tax=Physocladia obscura TaxID=109957 RepID=A0AAD5T5F8_9FUNG|nr:Protein dennd6a [Physocladia obscura]